MTPWLDDGDVTLYLGDALETVRGLPDESVDCVVTSPPYWGLRDYGTGEWDGGDPDCDHLNYPGAATGNKGAVTSTPMVGDCVRCGARRVDQQMGLEPTPDLFVANMVELFREIRRVLAPHGTCWVNLGDSYAGSTQSGSGRQFVDGGKTRLAEQDEALKGVSTGVPLGLKPKDLVGIPWRVAFALQQDGWWLRSDIIWAKPNPMPESVTDRPTKSHEYVFLLTKQPRYWFDTEAVREKADEVTRRAASFRDGGVYTASRSFENNGDKGKDTHGDGEPASGRNVRSVWQIATQPYPEAHFATYPEELARRCILAGCPVRVCRVCGKPSERILEPDEEYRALLSQRQRPAPLGAWLRTKREAAGLRQSEVAALFPSRSGGLTGCVSNWELDKNIPTPDQWEVLKEALSLGSEKDALLDAWYEWERSWASGGLERGAGANKTVSATRSMQSIGWSDCGHNNWRPGVTLDPFIGSGTTAKVARDHQRHAIGIDLNQEYLELAARRLQQLSLLT